MITKLRIILEAEADVFRDIEIKDDQTLLDLHGGIKEAFDLEGDEMASFYLSNDEWFQGSEIPMEDISEGDPVELMKDIKILEVIPEKGNKMIYVYDFLNLWTFYVEVVETDVISVNSEFPATVFAYGERPEEPPKSDLLIDLDFDDMDFDEDEEDDLDEFGTNEYW